MATMKMTLLEMVQSILDSVNADEVSSITDTEEAQIVAGIIKDVYYASINTRWWPEHYDLFQLTPVANNLYPTTMIVPENVGRIEWIKYNKSTTGGTSYAEVTWLEPEEFAKRMFNLNATSTDVSEFDDIVSGTPILVWNNRMPTYYTSFNDNYLVFDAYDSDVDTTLQGSKSVGWGRTIPTFTISDTFTPDADPEFFPYLLAESKSMSHSILLKTVDQKIEQQARRQKVHIQNDKLRVGSKNARPNYGRS